MQQQQSTSTTIPPSPTTTPTTTASDTKVKVERTTSRSGDPKEKIKISAKLNENELKKDSKSQMNCGLYFILQMLALVTLILMVIWFIENFGGLSFQTSNEDNSSGGSNWDQFLNLHPIFMVFGLVYVLANCKLN